MAFFGITNQGYQNLFEAHDVIKHNVDLDPVWGSCKLQHRQAAAEKKLTGSLDREYWLRDRKFSAPVSKYNREAPPQREDLIKEQCERCDLPTIRDEGRPYLERCKTFGGERVKGTQQMSAEALLQEMKRPQNVLDQSQTISWGKGPCGSNFELRRLMGKNARDPLEPVQKYRRPLTAAQEIGWWRLDDPIYDREPWTYTARKTHQESEMTKFAKKMKRSNPSFSMF